MPTIQKGSPLLTVDPEAGLGGASVYVDKCEGGVELDPWPFHPNAAHALKGDPCSTAAGRRHLAA